MASSPIAKLYPRWLTRFSVYVECERTMRNNSPKLRLRRTRAILILRSRVMAPLVTRSVNELRIAEACPLPLRVSETRGGDQLKIME